MDSHGFPCPSGFLVGKVRQSSSANQGYEENRHETLLNGWNHIHLNSMSIMMLFFFTCIIMNYFGQHLSAGDSAEPSSQATSRPADGSVLWDGTWVDHQGLSNAQGWPWLAPALSDILKKKTGYWNVGNTIINHPPVITIHKWYVCSQMSGLWLFYPH